MQQNEGSPVLKTYTTQMNIHNIYYANESTWYILCKCISLT